MNKTLLVSIVISIMFCVLLIPSSVLAEPVDFEIVNEELIVESI